MSENANDLLIGNPMVFRPNLIEDSLERMRGLGFEAVEICPPEIGACVTDALKRRFAERVASQGMTLVRLNTAAADYFVPLSSRDDRVRVLDGLKRDIDAAAALGVGQLLTWEGRPPEGVSRDEIHGGVLEATAELFQGAIGYARQAQVRLSVEVHPFTLGIDTGFLVALCDRLDPEYFGVTYDFCHFGVGLPDGYIDAIERLGGRIHHLHYSDSDRRSSELHFPPGEGSLDLGGIVRALKAVPFSGTCMLDLWSYPFPIEGARIGVPCMRKAMVELGVRRP